MILEEENERIREFDGVLAPDRESEGDIEIGENVEGDVTISLVLWLLGIGIKEGFIGGSICHKISGGLIAIAQMAGRQRRILLQTEKQKGGCVSR